MKHILNTEQVTENLKRLFPGKDIKCTDFWEGFYIETNTTKIVVINKMVWVKPSLQMWGQYCAYCNQCGKMYQKLRTKIGTCIPFTISTKARDRERHEQIDLILIACGLKKEKKEKVISDIDRLRELKLSHYVDFYKLIKEVKVKAAYIELKENDYGKDYKALTIEHETGKFSFPIELPEDDQQGEIKSIFYRLLNLPIPNFTVTIKAKSAA